MIHHSLTQDGKTVSWQAIRWWHMGLSGSKDPKSPNYNPYTARPDRDIGYHFGIELINDHYEILVGRELDEEGAHCVGMNARALGICFIGNFDLAEPPIEQWMVGVRFVRSLCRILMIPVVNVVGHRDFAPKTCPGKKFDLERFRREIASIK
jgi:N-acetylmuramoyl-L-alanine amidase